MTDDKQPPTVAEINDTEEGAVGLMIKEIAHDICEEGDELIRRKDAEEYYGKQDIELYEIAKRVGINAGKQKERQRIIEMVEEVFTKKKGALMQATEKETPPTIEILKRIEEDLKQKLKSEDEGEE